MIYLAHKAPGGEKIGIKKISEDLEITAPFLGKILQILAKNKVLHSTKGPHGGFGLARRGEDISLYEIVEIIDGDGLFTDCLLGAVHNEDQEAPCPLYEQFKPIRDQLNDMFRSTSIGHIAEKFEQHEQFSL
jgi:Rrf2 family protein